MKRIDARTVELTPTEKMISFYQDVNMDKGMGVVAAFDKALTHLGITRDMVDPAYVTWATT